MTAAKKMPWSLGGDTPRRFSRSSESKNKSKLQQHHGVEHLRFLSLFVFDDLDNHRIACRAFKRAFVVIRLVWRNSREPHRYVAFFAFREFDIGAINEMGRLHKASRLAVQAGARPRLSVTGALSSLCYSLPVM